MAKPRKLIPNSARTVPAISSCAVSGDTGPMAEDVNQELTDGEPFEFSKLVIGPSAPWGQSAKRFWGLFVHA